MKVFQRNDAARFVVESQMMKRQHITLRKKLFPVGGGLVSVGKRLSAGCFATPYAYIHAKCAAIARHQLTNTAIAPDPQCFTAQNAADTRSLRA